MRCTVPQLAPWDFECMFVSPLKRARETGDIVWGGRQAPTIRLPSLREIDLYSFQAGGEGEREGEGTSWGRSPSSGPGVTGRPLAVGHAGPAVGRPTALFSPLPCRAWTRWRAGRCTPRSGPPGRAHPPSLLLMGMPRWVCGRVGRRGQ